MPSLPEDKIESLAHIAIRHGAAIGRLQLFGEVARLGFSYANVVADVEHVQGLPRKALHDQLEEYVGVQIPDLYDLYSLVVVRLWSILEAYVDDVCALLLTCLSPENLSEKMKRVRIPIELALSEPSEERTEGIIGAIQNSVGAQLKSGVGRFEEMLQILDLGGAVNTGVKNALFELSKYRNCIVHSDGIIDTDLCTAIPVFRNVKGTRLGVTAKEARQFLFAILWYFIEIQRRLLPTDFAGLPNLLKEQDNYLERMANPMKYPTQIPFPIESV